MLTELYKIKRSPLWLICLITPVLAVGIGAANYQANRDQLDSHWGSFTAQTGLFYSLLFFAVSAGIVGSALWSSDRKARNWSLLLSIQPNALKLVVSKLIAAVVVLGIMHLTFSFLTIASGLLMGIPEVDVVGHLFNSLFPLIALIPLAAAQNLFACAMRSFGGPIAVCMALSIVGFAVISSPTAALFRFVLPHALGTYSLAWSSPAFAMDSRAGAGQVALEIVGAAIVLTAVLVWLNRWVIVRRLS